jgi:hypothetical protein
MFVKACLPMLVSLSLLMLTPDISDAKDLAGVYLLNADSSDSVRSAVDIGTANMNFLIRSIARDRILQTNPIYKRVRLSHDDASVDVQFDSKPPIHVPLDGAPVSWVREDGGLDDVSGTWSGSRLVMLLSSPDGNRINTFRLAADGETMTLHVELTSPYFSAPIRYSLIYKRRDS